MRPLLQAESIYRTDKKAEFFFSPQNKKTTEAKVPKNNFRVNHKNTRLTMQGKRNTQLLNILRFY